MLNVFLERLLQDLLASARNLRRNSRFAIPVVLVIALGLGAATAVFSVVDRLLFRSLPYPASDRMVSLGITLPWVEGEFLFSNDYFRLREHQSGIFSELTSWTGIADCDLSEANPKRLACAQVEANFLQALGIVPLLGRSFRTDEDRPNVPQVALASYGLWKSRFGAATGILDRVVNIDGSPTRIIGVLPPQFELPNLARVDFLIPQDVAFMQYIKGGGRALRVVGRLAPGVTAAQALARATPYIVQKWMRAQGLHTAMRGLRDYQVGDVRLAAWLLLAATIAILLIVASNVANLLIARSAGRQREFAVRAALGAGRGRLLQQTLAESFFLSGLGAVISTAIAWMLIQIFQRLGPAGIPRMQQASLDGRVLLLLFLAVIVLSLVFGVSAWSEKPWGASLTTGARVAGRARNIVRPLLTIAQVAISLVLVVVSVLLIHSLLNLQRVAPGIAVDHVTTAEIAVGAPRYPNAISRQQFFETLAARLQALPGVKAVAVSDTAPPIGFVHTRPGRTFRVVGQPDGGPEPTGIVAWRSVTPDYLKALNIPILQGRSFTAPDATGKDNPIVINQTWARHLFGRSNPVGKVIGLSPNTLLTVVGVAANVKNDGLSQPTLPEYYVARKRVTDQSDGRDAVLASRALHWYDGDAFLIVRSSARTSAVASWIRNAVADLDPTVPVSIGTMQERVAALSERPRFTTVLLTFFGLVGMILAAAGLYSLISFLVSQRTQEVGIRMALGATPAQIGQLMMRYALYCTSAGILCGATITFFVVRSLRSMVFQVSPENPMLFFSAAVLMILVALAATLVPSLRAARIDPVEALRQE